MPPPVFAGDIHRLRRGNLWFPAPSCVVNSPAPFAVGRHVPIWVVANRTPLPCLFASAVPAKQNALLLAGAGRRQSSRVRFRRVHVTVTQTCRAGRASEPTMPRWAWQRRSVSSRAVYSASCPYSVVVPTIRLRVGPSLYQSLGRAVEIFTAAVRCGSAVLGPTCVFGDAARRQRRCRTE